MHWFDRLIEGSTRSVARRSANIPYHCSTARIVGVAE